MASRAIARLRIVLNDQADARRLQAALRPYRDPNGAQVLALFDNGRAAAQVALSDTWRVRLAPRLFAELRYWLGKDSVQVIEPSLSRAIVESLPRTAMARTPNPIELRESNGVKFFVDYHKTKIEGEKNPKFQNDPVSKYILDLKKSENYRFKLAVEQVSKALVPWLARVTKSNADYVLACVPSSQAGKWSPGIEGFISKACEANRRFTASPRVLRRHKTIDKLAAGGPRALRVHLESINVAKRSDVKGKRVLLLDDVTTTGHSMEACKQLLEAAGAEEVVCVAIAKTADD